MKTLIPLLILLAGCSKPPEPPKISRTERALAEACAARYGQFAVSRNDPDTWVECYTGRKKIWGVKL